MIDILPVALLILLFYGAKPVKPLHDFNAEEYLSIDTGKSYRGFFAIVVIFHHLAQRTRTGVLFRYFENAGYLAVAFFFFLSGYGLQKSYITKGDGYKKGFLINRIPSVLIPYIIITAVYWLMNLVGGKFYSLKGIIMAIVNGSPVVSHSWYIITILVFYIFYWCLMLVCGKRYFLMIILGTVWYFLYSLSSIKMGYGGWWYNASQLLIVGMFWATYESKLLEILKKTYIWIAPAIWVIFVDLFFFQSRIAALINIPYSSFIITVFTAILFVLSVMLLAQKIQIGNRLLRFLGDISLEIYISQGLFMPTLRSKFIYIENEFLWCLAVLIGTIIFSCFFHRVIQAILKRYKQLCSKILGMKAML